MTAAPSCRSMPASSLVELVLLRHGIAVERVEGRDAADRPLTPRGRSRTQAVMEALVAGGMQLDRLVTSPYDRALETAQIALQAGLAPVLDSDDRLCPGGLVAELLHDLGGRIALVGHEPDLGLLACALLGLPPGSLRIRKAGLVQLRFRPGGWTLEGLLRPGLLPCTQGL